jgi:hypothetical protein
MTQEHKTKFISDLVMDQENVAARKPFKVENENQRRFVRLEISTPMSLQKIRDEDGNFWSEGEWHTIHGMILNISAGGLLVEADQLLGEGEIVVMTFTLQNVEQLDGILGIVKRSEQDEEGCLVGIEFIDRSCLQDRLSQGEMEQLSDKLSTFNEGVRTLISKFIYRENAGSESV